MFRHLGEHLGVQYGNDGQNKHNNVNAKCKHNNVNAKCKHNNVNAKCKHNNVNAKCAADTYSKFLL